jgi:hypothetical protein
LGELLPSKLQLALFVIQASNDCVEPADLLSGIIHLLVAFRNKLVYFLPQILVFCTSGIDGLLVACNFTIGLKLVLLAVSLCLLQLALGPSQRLLLILC